MKAATRGVAALPVTLMLSFVALLAVAYSQRGVLFDIQAATNLTRATQAHEAAQAGLAWALARLNQPAALDEDCLASEATTARPWSERLAPGPLHASCSADGAGWSCHCPASGDARRVDTADAPSFSVVLSPLAGAAPRWQLSATGHSGHGGPPARVHQQLGRLPALDTLPAAAVTVRGQARFESGPVQVEHSDAGGSGLTIHSGGALFGPALVVVGTPGTPAAASLLADDTALAELSAAALHASLFRLDDAAWRAQPGAATVDCTSACDTALHDAARHHTLIRLSGGLRLHTALAMGTPERPVLMVVEGPVELQAAVRIHGLVYTRHARWTDIAGSSVQGAVVADGDLHMEGPTRIRHDLPVLLALHLHAGTFAPLLGSWRDL